MLNVHEKDLFSGILTSLGYRRHNANRHMIRCDIQYMYLTCSQQRMPSHYTESDEKNLTKKN